MVAGVAAPELVYRWFSGGPSRARFPDLFGVQARLHAACPYLFLVLALATSLFVAWTLPPFMGVDEVSQTHRANLATFGLFLAQPVRAATGLDAGGPIDQSIDAANAPFERLKFHPERKVRPQDEARARRIGWAGQTAKGGFLNTAVYPPVFYLPASGALAAGRLFGLPVVASLRLARTANAATCVLVGFAALLIAGRARLFLFAVLLLPMSVFLYATVTQDGGMIVAAALGAALISRAQSQGRPMTPSELVGAAIAFGLVGMAKPPYALIGLAILAAPGPGPRRWQAAAAAVGAAAAWYGLMAAAIPLPTGNGAVPAAQLHFLLGHPAAGLRAVVDTVTGQWIGLSHGFIGVLGWLDTDLPAPVYTLAWVALVLALAISVPRRWTGLSVPVVAALAATVAGIFAALYLSWTAVGAAQVNGLQGRYFLPLAMIAPLVFGPGRPVLEGRRHGWQYLTAAAGAGLFAVFSLSCVAQVVVGRYYPG